VPPCLKNNSTCTTAEIQRKHHTPLEPPLPSILHPSSCIPYPDPIPILILHPSFILIPILPIPPPVQAKPQLTPPRQTDFGSLVGQICAAVNATSTAASANSTGTASAATTGTGSPIRPTVTSTLVPFTGAAAAPVVAGGLLGVVGIVAGMVL